MSLKDAKDLVALCFSLGLESNEQVKEFYDSLLTRFSEGQKISEDDLVIEIRCYTTTLAQYHLKLAGAIWFDGALPLNPDEKSTYYLLLKEVSKDIGKKLEKLARRYYGWTCVELARVCAKMPRPDIPEQNQEESP